MGDLCVHVVADELAVIVVTNCIRVEDWTGYISHCPQVSPVLARLLCCTCSRSGVDLFTLIFCVQLIFMCPGFETKQCHTGALFLIPYHTFFSVWPSQFILTLD